MTPMNHVERFRAVMNFQPVDRLPVWEWAMWWDKTIERWHLPVGRRQERLSVGRRSTGGRVQRLRDADGVIVQHDPADH